MNPFKWPLPSEVKELLWCPFEVGNWVWEASAGHRGNWVETESQGGPASCLLSPSCPLSPLMEELRIWTSSLLATDEEAKQAKRFLKYQHHQRKFKRSCSLLPYQTPHVMETATLTRAKKRTCHRRNPTHLWGPFPKVQTLRSSCFQFSTCFHTDMMSSPP